MLCVFLSKKTHFTKEVGESLVLEGYYQLPDNNCIWTHECYKLALIKWLVSSWQTCRPLRSCPNSASPHEQSFLCTCPTHASLLAVNMYPPLWDRLSSSTQTKGCLHTSLYHQVLRITAVQRVHRCHRTRQPKRYPASLHLSKHPPLISNWEDWVMKCDSCFKRCISLNRNLSWHFFSLPPSLPKKHSLKLWLCPVQ